jgi:precorrin-2/cobalt-factor-2 C20-methyltransferase
MKTFGDRPMQTWGTFWGIGVGPGDADWLTLKGLRVLQSVPVVAMPQGRDGQPGMAYGIVKDFLSADQILLPLSLPFVLDAHTLEQAWQAAAAQLVAVLQTGQDVAFIAEGDISFYSTFTYMAKYVHQLAPEVTIQPIPGICSPLAAAAALHLPLAIADEKIVILPALYQVDALIQALDWAEVVVLMKVASVFSTVWPILADRQLLDQASLVEWVGGAQQTLFPTLRDLADYRPPYFSILIVRQTPYGF